MRTQPNVTGNVTVSGSGSVEVDGRTIGGSGSSLTIGGNLTVSSSVFDAFDVGNTAMTSASTVTVNGATGLSASGTGQINILGNSGVQATLNIANAAAGFGTTGTETGNVYLQNDALLEFKSGQITTINGALTLNGANARVADASDTAHNSALLGLSSVTGFFGMLNGATVGPTTGDLSVTGSGSVQVDGRTIGGQGGSSLTIGGNLTVSSNAYDAFDVGNTGIASASTVTVNGALGLNNGSQIIIQGGGASASLTVANNVSTAGSLVVGGASSAGASVLTAPVVNVTGGTLEGFGTVNGVVNNNGGGSILGGVLNGPYGALTVNGIYNQSGTGVLQANINTNLTPQSSIVNVAGSPGAPGAAGSVNLVGGVLLIDAQSALALNTPYTVMTFGAGHLYGLFTQVQTEGAVGSHTGDSNSVNLGNGDTIDVFYNESTGQVQVEMVATPASNTYQWNIGSGTWNAASGADWNLPGNGTIPGPTSDVTIGNLAAGGTVTLGLDQTINSLSVTNGYALNGAGHSISTNANAQIAVGGSLSLADMNVGGAFTVNGGATFNGVLTANGTVTVSGSLTLNNGGEINDSTLAGAGTIETASGATGTLRNDTISHGTTYTTPDNAVTVLQGAIANNGAIDVTATTDNTDLVITGATTLSGTGSVVLSDAATNRIYSDTAGSVLDNQQTISGAGEIFSNGNLSLLNDTAV